MRRAGQIFVLWEQWPECTELPTTWIVRPSSGTAWSPGFVVYDSKQELNSARENEYDSFSRHRHSQVSRETRQHSTMCAIDFRTSFPSEFKASDRSASHWNRSVDNYGWKREYLPVRARWDRCRQFEAKSACRRCSTMAMLMHRSVGWKKFVHDWYSFERDLARRWLVTTIDHCHCSIRWRSSAGERISRPSIKSRIWPILPRAGALREYFVPFFFLLIKSFIEKIGERRSGEWSR